MYQNLAPTSYLADPSRYHLIDVRTDDEWAACHLPEATHLPLVELIDRAPALPRDKPLALICRTGGRSARACQILDELGFACFNVSGGMRLLVSAQAACGRIPPEQGERMMANL